MPTPPRPTQPSEATWDVPGEPAPRRETHDKPDRMGLFLVAGVVIAAILAIVILVL